MRAHYNAPSVASGIRFLQRRINYLEKRIEKFDPLEEGVPDAIQCKRDWDLTELHGLKGALEAVLYSQELRAELLAYVEGEGSEWDAERAMQWDTIKGML